MSKKVLVRQSTKAKPVEKSRMALHYENLRLKLEKEQRVIVMAREARGWTQKDLGEKIYVSASAISRYENGTAPAPWGELEKVMPELTEMRQKGCMEYCPFPQPCVPTGKCIYRKLGRRSVW